MAGKRARPPIDVLTRTVSSIAPIPGVQEHELPGLERVREVALDDLWIEHQPRELVPEEVLQRLIVAGTARPTALLDELRWAAEADSYYAEVLAALEELAQSVASQGVLQPIQVVLKEERLVVRDGHRRCVASVISGRTTVPALRVEEATDLEGIAHPLIVNLQRQDLTAIEKGAALLRLALLVGRRFAESGGEMGGGAAEVTIDVLLGDEGPGMTATARESVPANGRSLTGHQKALAGEVRERVCAMVGLKPRTYYYLLALNRLTLEARAAGRALTAHQLQPITRLPPERQHEVVVFAARRGLTNKEITSLVRVAQGEDRDGVARVLRQLQPDRGDQTRTSTSWEALLHAVPVDVGVRCQALHAELQALGPRQRAARLRQIRAQVPLLRTLLAEYEAILAEDTSPLAEGESTGTG